MAVFKDGLGYKRIAGLGCALFGMTMIVVRAATKTLTPEELIIWLGFITASLGITGGLTVAEKRRG